MSVMRSAVSARLALLLAAFLLWPNARSTAQPSTLPATSPTSSLLPTGTAGPPPTRAAVGHPAEVSYANGLLSVSASNASLNQILREIGRVTGMKITGGVTEDRVFGSYGPAPASQVLASLLDGTSTNILIVANATDAPAELILTPRHGGPTPPNPNSAQNNAGYEPPQQPFPSNQLFRGGQQSSQPILTGPPGLGGLPPSNGGQTGAPINGGADLGSTPGAFVPAGQSPPDATAQPGIQSGAANGSADPSQPQSPNGVSTPQQIYEQLMRLRQQQQQQQQTNPQ